MKITLPAPALRKSARQIADYRFPMPNHLPRRLVLAWLFCVALFLAAVWGLTPGSGALAEGEAADCCAEHSEEVSHGPSHHFFGVNMDARNPDNVICEPDSNDESIRCPDACTRPVPAGTPRVRRAIHTLTAEQWTRVVNAMWVMRTVSTKDGVEKYGPFYRVRHAAMQPPRRTSRSTHARPR